MHNSLPLYVTPINIDIFYISEVHYNKRVLKINYNVNHLLPHHLPISIGIHVTCLSNMVQSFNLPSKNYLPSSHRTTCF